MGKKNKTRYLILGLLSEKPLSGYEIKKIVDLRFQYFWSESYGQIYPELSRMESENIIEKVVSEENTGRKNSCKYKITDQGLVELKDWLIAPVEKEMIRYEILLKLYFSTQVSPDVMIDHIREFQINHRKQQHMFDLFHKDLEEHLDTHDNHSEVLMVLGFGQKVWKAYDEWCNETIELLNKRKDQ